MRNALLLGLGLSAFLAAGCRTNARYEDCSPGEQLLIGCTTNIGDPCTGDPTLSVCDDSVLPESCERDTPAPTLLGYRDDAVGLCPELTVTCPASGRIAINPEPFGSRSYTCRFDVRSLAP